MSFVTAAAISGGAMALGAVIGALSSEADRNAASEAREKALKKINSLGAGPDLSRKIFLEEFKSAGVLTPEMEKAVDVDATKIGQIQEDPRFKEAQMQALRGMQERGKTGFTAEERAQLAQSRAEAERSAEAKRGQILAGLRARGAMDSGAGLAAQLGSSEELASRQLEASDRVSSMAGQRALEAMAQSGAMAGQMRGQEFDIARTKATAEDELRRFNVQNQMAVQQRNIERQNMAQQYNLGQQQRLMEANIQQRNAELQRQRAAEQQMYQNKMNVAAMQANAQLGAASQYQQQAATTQQAWNQAAAGTAEAATSIYGSYADNN